MNTPQRVAVDSPSAGSDGGRGGRPGGPMLPAAGESPPYQPSMTIINRELAPISAALADMERLAKFVLDALLSAEHDLSFFHGLIATDCVDGPRSANAVFWEIDTRETLTKLHSAIRELSGRDKGVGCDL